jgi:hypothetical protein
LSPVTKLVEIKMERGALSESHGSDFIGKSSSLGHCEALDTIALNHFEVDIFAQVTSLASCLYPTNLLHVLTHNMPESALSISLHGYLCFPLDQFQQVLVELCLLWLSFLAMLAKPLEPAIFHNPPSIFGSPNNCPRK